MSSDDKLLDSISDETLHEKIAEIVRTMSCPKDFVCIRSGFEALCKSHDIGLHSYLECLEENPAKCRFSVGFGYKNFCTCPMRFYIARNVKKEQDIARRTL
ncbi:MAG: hypothetical protein K8R90_06900 [Candidatus Cloacimonetes bacterium]|nr:hypothetical protein [Candidatus Cloacimonadota bacterium]